MRGALEGFVFEAVDHSHDAVFYQAHVEVNQQSKKQVGETEMSEESLFVNGGEQLSINRMLEELAGIRETLVVYPRRQGQRRAPTAICLTRMTALQQRLFSLLGLQRFVPATR